MVKFIDPEFNEECSLTHFLSGGSKEFSERVERFEVNPCKSEEDKYLIESNLVDRFCANGMNMNTLKFILDSNSKRFMNIQLSEELGVYDINWERHKIKIYSSGKVEVREGTDKGKMVNLFENVEKMIILSLVCGECDEILLDCIGDKCSFCRDDSNLDKINLEDYFHPTIEKSLEKLLDIYKELLRPDYSSDFLEDKVKMDNFRTILKDSFRITSDNIISSTEKNNILVGWMVQSLIFDTFRLLEAFESFSKNNIADDDIIEDFLRRFMSVNKRIAILHEGSEVKIEKLVSDLHTLSKDWINFQKDSNIQKCEDEFYFVENTISGNISNLKELRKIYF